MRVDRLLEVEGDERCIYFTRQFGTNIDKWCKKGEYQCPVRNICWGYKWCHTFESVQYTGCKLPANPKFLLHHWAQFGDQFFSYLTFRYCTIYKLTPATCVLQSKPKPRANENTSTSMTYLYEPQCLSWQTVLFTIECRVEFGYNIVW